MMASARSLDLNFLICKMGTEGPRWLVEVAGPLC